MHISVIKLKYTQWSYYSTSSSSLNTVTVEYPISFTTEAFKLWYSDSCSSASAVCNQATDSSSSPGLSSAKVHKAKSDMGFSFFVIGK